MTARRRKRVTLRDAIAELRKVDRTLALVSGQMTMLEHRLFFIEEQLSRLLKTNLPGDDK